MICYILGKSDRYILNIWAHLLLTHCHFVICLRKQNHTIQHQTCTKSESKPKKFLIIQFHNMCPTSLRIWTWWSDGSRTKWNFIKYVQISVGDLYMLEVYGPITYGFIHRSWVFDIRWKPLFFSLRMCNFTCNRCCL